MKLNCRNLFSLVIFLLLFLPAKGQEASKKRWDVSVSYGLALPLDGFSKVTPEKSIIYTPLGTPQLNGLYKRNNSSAKPGYYLSVNTSYNVSKKIAISLEVGRAVNEVNVAPINDFVKLLFPSGAEFVQDSYRTSFILPGISYFHKLLAWELTLTQKIGVGILDFPDYRIDLIDPNTGLVFATVKDEGNKPASVAVMAGWNLAGRYSVNQHIFVGVDMGLSLANFIYNFQLRMVPGGSTTIYFSDAVTYRQANLGLRVGYRF